MILSLIRLMSRSNVSGIDQYEQFKFVYAT